MGRHGNSDPRRLRRANLVPLREFAGRHAVIRDPAIDRDVATVGRLPSVQRILDVVAEATGMRFTAVARVDDVSWTACAVHDEIDFGLKPGDQLELGTTICNQIRQHRKPVLFGHASADPEWSTHPARKMYGFESYISIPIFRADGAFFGTLCAIDPKPARLDDLALLRSLELYAQLVAAHLEAEERVADSDRELLAAHEVARLREQFIAVLGHDLGGPLHALRLGVDMLEDANLDPSAMRGHLPAHLARMRRSAVRMQDLIQDLLDFARGRLGSGIPVSLRDEAALLAQLEQVLSEARTAHPERTIVWRNQLQAPVQADDRRVGQVLANLLGNALAHGDRDRQIEVLARSDTAGFELSVRNYGPAIPPEVRARLFEPFWRASANHASAGLGLGLYICAEIARAHGGSVDVVSDDVQGTRFRFTIPPSVPASVAPAAAV